MLNFFERYSFYVIAFASLVLAILFGMVSSSANFLVISIITAAFIGIILLNKIEWMIWLVLLMGMILIGILPILVPNMDAKVGWPVSILCFVLMVISLFKAVTDPEIRKNTPTFIWLLVAFFIYALVTSLAQWYSPQQYFGGFKRYFQVWGLMFALCWMSFGEYEIHQWQKFFLIVALLQLPSSIYELVVWYPIRESVSDLYPGMIPIDVVSGTFGATRFGGGASGEMATFLVVVLAFLFSWRMQNIISVRRFAWLSLLVLVPLFLGETKSVVVILPLMFIVLYRREMLTRPHYGIIMSMVCALLIMGMGYVYLNIMHMSLENMVTATLRYNLYEEGYGSSYLNRTTALTFWATHQGAESPISFFFGNGLGSSHEQTKGHIDIRYPKYGVGLTSASTMLWDMGVFGSLQFVIILATAWRAAGRLYREATDSILKADAAAIEVALALFTFHYFYGLVENVPIQIVFATVMGYLAWLYRKHLDSLSEHSL